MKKKIKKILVQKIKEVEKLNEGFAFQGISFFCEGYSTKMDKLETEIDLLKLLLKD